MSKDYNKRMKTKELALKTKKKQNFVVKTVKIEEILDETGEVNESTIIKISFEGILLHLSVGGAYKLFRDLREVLES
jgi:thiamine phosphate synthase YjbQ (UPF0047 family)